LPKICCQHRDRFAVYAAYHVLAAPLNGNESCKPQFFEMVRNLRVDLISASHMAADLAYRWAVHWPHITRFLNGHRAAAGTQKLENVQPRWISQCFEHCGRIQLAHNYYFHIISFREMMK
jgi:hypothetical protein